MIYTADDVWGAVAAAHRINDGYSKVTEWNFEVHPAVVVKEANKLMVRRWIREGNLSAVTDQDRARGREIRDHFNSYVLLMLSGKINDFQQQAYRIAQMTEFTDKNGLELAIASSLGSVYERDLAQQQLMDLLRASQPLSGQAGDRVEGEITVLSVFYSSNFNRYWIRASMGGSIVGFWSGSDLPQGTQVRIQGRIRALRDDNSVQLNYVKVKTVG